ncbi:MAG: hypothetical protein J5965_06160, partial [Aeriscardovia sp.]|nr:hypothetical protein [Aeriscardovia sp.]
MIHVPELTKAIAQAERNRNKKLAVVDEIIRTINVAEGLVAQIGEQNHKETDKLIEALKENADLKTQIAAVKKELMDQTIRAHRLEDELKVQVQKYQEAAQSRTVVNNVYYSHVAAEYDDDADFQDTKRKEHKGEERTIPMSTVLSFGSTRMTQEAVQTLVDLLYFAINDRTPEEDKNIQKMMDDFRKTLRPQVNAKDSTQNFY